MKRHVFPSMNAPAPYCVLLEARAAEEHDDKAPVCQDCQRIERATHQHDRATRERMIADGTIRPNDTGATPSIADLTDAPCLRIGEIPRWVEREVFDA